MNRPDRSSSTTNPTPGPRHPAERQTQRAQQPAPVNDRLPHQSATAKKNLDVLQPGVDEALKLLDPAVSVAATPEAICNQLKTLSTKAATAKKNLDVLRPGAIAALKEAGVTVSPNEVAATIKSQLLARCKQATTDQNKVDELQMSGLSLARWLAALPEQNCDLMATLKAVVDDLLQTEDALFELRRGFQHLQAVYSSLTCQSARTLL